MTHIKKKLKKNKKKKTLCWELTLILLNHKIIFDKIIIIANKKKVSMLWTLTFETRIVLVATTFQ